MPAEVNPAVHNTMGRSRQDPPCVPVDNGVPAVGARPDNGSDTTARSPGGSANYPRAMTESPQQGDPMPDIIPPPATDNHPRCPICRDRPSRLTEHVDGTRWTAVYLCVNNHLYQLAWTVAA